MIADMPVSAAAALFRIHMSRPVLAMSTVMERASAMMSTTDIMSAAPLMKKRKFSRTILGLKIRRYDRIRGLKQ